MKYGNYTLNEKDMYDIQEIFDDYGNLMANNVVIDIQGLDPTYPEPITEGSTRTVTLTFTGTSPFTAHWLIDGTEQSISPTWDSTGTVATFHWTFNELGSSAGIVHTYEAYGTDSCPVGSLSSNRESYNITIVSAQAPAPTTGAGLSSWLGAETCFGSPPQTCFKNIYAAAAGGIVALILLTRS